MPNSGLPIVRSAFNDRCCYCDTPSRTRCVDARPRRRPAHRLLALYFCFSKRIALGDGHHARTRIEETADLKRPLSLISRLHADARESVEAGVSAPAARPVRWSPFPPERVPSDRAIEPARVRAGGKFLFVGDEKLYVRGVTYGAFQPDADGHEYHDLAMVERDMAQIAAAGFNTVRIPHTTPPRSLLDAAWRHGLRVMVGLSAEQSVGYLIDRRGAPGV